MAYQPKSYRKFLATSVATAIVATVAAAPVGAAGSQFNDINDVEFWAGDAISYLSEKGAIEGMGASKFQPHGELTRAQAATMLARTLNLDIDNNAQTSFKDAKTHWASKYIAALQEQKPGVIDGRTDGSFDPETAISRQELAKMVVQAYELQQDKRAIINFTDTDGSGVWGKEDIEVLASLGIIQGYGDKTFKPRATVTRAESTVFVHRTEVDDVRVPVEYAELEIEPFLELVLDKEADGGTYTLSFSAKDQFGDDAVISKEIVNAYSLNEEIATASVEHDGTNLTGIKITPVKVGKTQVHVTIGSKDYLYDVNIKQVAVDARKAADKAEAIVKLNEAIDDDSVGWESKYTKVSWAAYQGAITAAKDIDTDSATTKEILEATQSVLNAKNTLKKNINETFLDKSNSDETREVLTSYLSRCAA